MRRRRRSTFAGSSSLGRVRWLEPVERRHRRRPPVVPALLLVLVLAGGAGVAWFVLARQAATERRQDVASHFASAWEKGDYRAMWRMITPERRRDWPYSEFSSSYRIAAEEATVKSTKAGPVGALVGDKVPVPVQVRTRDFGLIKGTVPFIVADRDGKSYLDWSP